MLIGKKSNGGKRLRSLLASALALVLTLGIAAPAFAASIEITGNNGEKYIAYKVLDVTTDNSGTGYNYTTDKQAVAERLQEYGYIITASSTGNLWYVSMDSNIGEPDTDGLTRYLYSLCTPNTTQLEALLGSAAGETTLTNATGNGNGATGSITGLDSGYYFVTSTLGALCMLNTAAETAEIKDKNEEPAVEKKVSDVNAQIGDTVEYTVTISVPEEMESLRLSDTLSDGLTLDDSSFKIIIDGGPDSDLSSEVDVTLNSDDTTTFTVDLTGYLSQVSDNGTIVVTYEAMINEKAVDTNPATNEAVISYGNNSSTSSESSTSTHLLTIEKTDSSGNPLNGAEFQITDADGYPVYVIELVKGSSYRVATSQNESGATDTIVVNDTATITGLDTEEYTVTETKAPDGYNLPSSSWKIEVTADNEALLEVENESGSLLPTAGGIGTTIIYIAGALLVVGGGVALYVRHRRA